MNQDASQDSEGKKCAGTRLARVDRIMSSKPANVSINPGGRASQRKPWGVPRRMIQSGIVPMRSECMEDRK